MTTYTSIATSEIDGDSPITESVLTRCRDNPIAITEGATGAPRIVHDALDVATVSAWEIIEGWTAKSGSSITYTQSAIASSSVLRLEWYDLYDTNDTGGLEEVFLNVRIGGSYSTDSDQHGIGISIKGGTAWSDSDANGMRIIADLVDDNTVGADRRLYGWIELISCNIATVSTLNGMVYGTTDAVSAGVIDTVMQVLGAQGSANAIDGFRVHVAGAPYTNMSGTFRLLGRP